MPEDQSQPLSRPVRLTIKGVMAMTWSSAIVVGGLATAHTPALTVSIWRLTAAAPLMALIALAAGATWPRREEIKWVLAVGVLLQGVQFAGVYTAIGEGVPAGLVALLIGTSPLLVAIVGAAFYHERMARIQWIGSALGVLGVIVAVVDELHGTLTATGLLLSLIGMLGLAGGALVQRHHPGQADPRSAISLQAAAGAVFLLPFVVFGPGFHVDMTYQAVAPIVYMLVPSIFGTLLFFWLLKREKGGEATSFLYLVPAVTAIASVPILGEDISPGVVVGLVFSLVGLNLVGSKADRAALDELDPNAGLTQNEKLKPKMNP